MALSAALVYEVRSTATAGNLNGGGFKTGASGTDYSQQNAAQWTAGDGTSTASTTFISATSTFTSAIVGNVLHITAGTGATVGWYEVTGYTDANTITLDRVSGTYTAATFYVGGAISLGSTLDDDFLEIMVPGNTVYIKNATYTLGEAVSVSSAANGTATAPVKLIGYNATRGDNPTGSTRPTFACGANAFAYAAHWDIYYMQFTTTASTGVAPYNYCNLVHCKITNNSTTVYRYGLYLNQQFVYGFALEVISYRGYGILFNDSYDTFFGCYVHDCEHGIKINNNFNAPVISNCIVSDNVSYAINIGTTAHNTTINQCTLYGAENKLGIGVSIGAGAHGAKLTSNIIVGFTTGVTHGTAGNTSGADEYNDYYNNTTDVTNWTKGSTDIAVNPAFTSVAQLTGATATTSGSVLTQSGGDFSTVTDNVDFVQIVSGTGVTAGKYLITSHTSDTITLDIAPGTNATANKVWQITTGHNFLPTGSI